MLIEEKKQSNKLFSLQFLPSRLEKLLSKSEQIIQNGHLLKREYLIDIVHNLIFRYYMKEENEFILNAVILKSRYGFIYNHYISYLVNNNIIHLVKNYIKGERSRIYKLNPLLLTERISRCQVMDRIILKKNTRIITNKKNKIDDDVKLKLISDLKYVEIDEKEAKNWVLVNCLNNFNSFNKNIYSIESIVENEIYHHFDDYGRLHTNYTVLNSHIRKNYITIDGKETFEIDIQNSQPFFLYLLLKDDNINKKELQIFKKIVLNGEYYEYITDKLKLNNRKDAKDLTYKVFFGKNHFNCNYDKKFISLFPDIHNFIKNYKKNNNGYKSLSHELQRMESELIFNNIIKKVYEYDPNIKLITIHDSIISSINNKDVITSIFNNEINKLKS